MSAAWAALDAATGAEQPDQNAITEAIRHAQRFRELTECVKAAESFLRGLSGKTSTRSPARQHTVTPSAVQPSPGSPSPDEASQADGEDTSTAFVGGDSTQQDNSTAGSKSHPQALASSTSAQLHDELETAPYVVSSHQEIDPQEAPHGVADQPATYAATSQPLTAPAQEQPAATKQYSLSPQAIASAKAAAVLALAHPASVSAESATAPSNPSSSPRSQQEQHSPAEHSSALPADESASVPTGARPPGGSMLEFLSFLLPAENPNKPTASPSRRQPPGFEASDPHTQSGPDSGVDLSRVEESVSESGLEDLHPHDRSCSDLNSAAQLHAAQRAPQQAPGPSRRAKPYQSTPSRGPAAPYQPPGIAAYHPPEDSGHESSEQWQQDSVYEPVEEQQPAVHVPIQRQAPAYNPVQQQQGPALYIPAPLPPGANASGISWVSTIKH